MQTFSWFTALPTVLLGLTLIVWFWLFRQAKKPVPLPAEWALSSRPVFSNAERRAYRLLREALPHHIILSKLALVRFCQPDDPGRVKYWFDLLGTSHVAFAICSANGRVLAAIDLETSRESAPRRSVQIKQAVLSACRVRYLNCSLDNLPSVAELQLLVPHTGTPGARVPATEETTVSLNQARDSLAHTVSARRAQRATLWQDSSLFQDSFFAPDSRLDALGTSDFSSLSDAAELLNEEKFSRTAADVHLHAAHASAIGLYEDHDIGGTVVRLPRSPNPIKRGT
jgi:hypothetical protein